MRFEIKSIDQRPASSEIAPEQQAVGEDGKGLERQLQVLEQPTGLLRLLPCSGP